MTMTFSFLFALIISGCLVLLWRQRQNIAHLETIRLGAGHIELARNLLEHLPQHRGMASALLNGDQSFQEKINAMQIVIDRDLAVLKTAIGTHGEHSALNTHYSQLDESWTRLKRELNRLSAAQSFERHTAMIGQVIYLINDIADEMRITAYPDQNMRPIVRANITVLPNMIEISGQARGIGTGVAAKGKITTALRIKIRFLCEHLNAALQNAHQTIEQSLVQARDKSAFDLTSLQSSRTATQHLLNTINEHLLQDEKVTITAGDYFAIGSAAFDNNLKLFDKLSQAIRQDIQQRAPAIKSAYYRSIFFCSGIIAASAAGVWGLS